MDNYRELKKIELENYDELKKLFRLRNAGTCENVVTSSFIWKDYYDARYYTTKYGASFIYKMGEEIFSSVPLAKEEDLKNAFLDLKDYYNNVLGKKLVIYLADEKAVNILGLSEDKYEVEEDRRYFDYVYDAEKLRTLSGKKYHKKKNHVNAFHKMYDGRYEMRELCCRDKEEVYKYLDRWHSMRNIEDEYHRDQYELDGIKYFINGCEKIDVKMFGVFIDGELEAFSLGTFIESTKTAYIHVEKANPEIRGLYPFINQQFLIHSFPEAELVNREDDMGLEGLRHAKMSYNPVTLAKKYNIFEK